MKKNVQSRASHSLTHPAVVGTVHNAASLAAAIKLGPADCDWLELRVDNFLPEPAKLHAAAGRMKVPRIVTVRHPSEGGASKALTNSGRRGHYENFMEFAGMINVELKQAKPMNSVLQCAREAGVKIILSHHDFAKMPAVKKLRELAAKARDAGADIFKVAAMARVPGDLALLIDFLETDRNSRMSLAVMGMGRYGKISRLVLAEAGSCLNYGFLGTANASGQWPAALLKERIAELRIEE